MPLGGASASRVTFCRERCRFFCANSCSTRKALGSMASSFCASTNDTCLATGASISSAHERVMRSAPLPALWVTGLSLFLTSYLLNAGYALERAHNGLGLVPVFGTLANVDVFSHNDTQLWWFVDAIVQAGGFALFLAGLAAKDWME